MIVQQQYLLRVKQKNNIDEEFYYKSQRIISRKEPKKNFSFEKTC